MTADADPHATGGPATHVMAGADTPSHAERVRTLLADVTSATLATVATDPAGYPFASLVDLAVAADGTPLLVLSTMAPHAANLAADPRASLLATSAGDGARLAAARVTLLGDVERLDAEDPRHADDLAAYRHVHPEAFWVEFPDFHVHRLAVRRIRYVRGFGEMSWVGPVEYALARPDDVARDDAAIVTHMNDDHADSLATMVAAFLPVQDAVAVQMLACDRHGFEVRIDLPEGGLAFGRLGFAAPVSRPEQVRGAMVDLVRRARGVDGQG